MATPSARTVGGPWPVSDDRPSSGKRIVRRHVRPPSAEARSQARLSGFRRAGIAPDMTMTLRSRKLRGGSPS